MLEATETFVHEGETVHAGRGRVVEGHPIDKFSPAGPLCKLDARDRERPELRRSRSKDERLEERTTSSETPYAKTVAQRHLAGPRKRPMLGALKNIVLTDPTTDERIEFIAERSLVAPNHEVFRHNPEARRSFELVDAVQVMKRASDRAERRLKGATTGREPWRLPVR